MINNVTGIMIQPKAYRVSAPMPARTPARTASPSNRPEVNSEERPAPSRFKMHHVSPIKMMINNIVDNPETLNRHNKSQPSTKNTESQATLVSNSLRARKNVSTTITSKSS